MQREKIVNHISVLKTLIEDWNNLESHELQEQAERLIIAKSAELAEFAEVSKKSETPYNCCDECENGILQQENAELQKQLGELRFQVGANLESMRWFVEQA